MGVEKTPAATREVAQHVHSLGVHLRKTYQNCDGDSLAPLPTEVLQAIIQDPGLTVAELAALLGKFPSNISVAVKDLVDRDLVRRAVNPEDKRFVRLFPSELALARVERVYDRWEVQFSEALTRLPKAEANRILAARHALSMLLNEFDTVPDSRG